jgi:hypothetical protein
VFARDQAVVGDEVFQRIEEDLDGIPAGWGLVETMQTPRKRPQLSMVKARGMHGCAYQNPGKAQQGKIGIFTDGNIGGCIQRSQRVKNSLLAPGGGGRTKRASCIFACVLTTVAATGVVCAHDRMDGGASVAPASTGTFSGDAEPLSQSHAEEQRLRDEWRRMQGARSQDSGFSDWQGAGLFILAATSILVVVALASRAR